MSTFGRHSVLAESSRPTFGFVMVRAVHVLSVETESKSGSLSESTLPDAVTHWHACYNQMPVPRFNRGREGATMYCFGSGYDPLSFSVSFSAKSTTLL